MTLMPGLEHLELGRLLFECRSQAMNRPVFLRLHRPVREVDRFTEHVQHAAKRRRPHGHRNRRAGVEDVHAALQAVGRLHRDGADAPFTKVLFDFGDDVDFFARGQRRDDAQRVVDGGQVSALVLNVDDGPDNLNDLADFLFARCGCHNSLNWVLGLGSWGQEDSRPLDP
jgi:hypothetical protein